MEMYNFRFRKKLPARRMTPYRQTRSSEGLPLEPAEFVGAAPDHFLKEFEKYAVLSKPTLKAISCTLSSVHVSRFFAAVMR